ncbi:MAG: hypothetical protein J1G02_05070 [Clostridiales bacterium]|nr:hypothetical protein [Clostridiales bacterium]
MKKKIWILVIALVIALTCLVACDSYASTLQNIQTLLKADYSVVTLNVTTVTSGITLNGNYSLSFDGDKTTVVYDFYRLNELDVNGDNADSFITRVQGTAVVQDGEIVEGDKSVNLPQEVNFNGISFKQAFFSNTTTTNAMFEADVINPQGFTGNNGFVCTDMHVKVMYSQSALTTMVITYVSERGSDVSVTYAFTK